ncbi:hypothetical protein KGQ20_18320 [Catenulispora sp. NF23]|uniref:Uncharacterized protein n=1 Tax=Catenulispora pinistramenti TaxID=2705254 RepID=A0ABS5KYK3_9ACTN|nr:hypothetical protein [Catenulispora pinistramenti]MBS2534731.1 hypothetical protein [Catenulispora pinistramenti]MBS2551152.1 hypothetical protein [Catenulispora pinistramenti]
MSGSFTVRVLAGSEAKDEQLKLAASNEANFPGGSYVVVTTSWNGHWSGNCQVFAAMSYTGDGWRLSDFTPTGRIGAGADSSVAQAFAKYPQVFVDIPAPPAGGKGPDEDTFDLSGKSGTATIIYAVDPSVSTGISTDMNVAAEVDCDGKARAAGRFGPR